MDRLVLKNIKASGRHGALPGEKSRPQAFEVEITVEFDASSAATTDDLGATIDYATVAEEAVRIVSEESFNLIEALASRIADAALESPRASAAEVEVRKMDPRIAVDLDYAAVVVRRSRS